MSLIELEAKLDDYFEFKVGRIKRFVDDLDIGRRRRAYYKRKELESHETSSAINEKIAKNAASSKSTAEWARRDEAIRKIAKAQERAHRDLLKRSAEYESRSSTARKGAAVAGGVTAIGAGGAYAYNRKKK